MSGKGVRVVEGLAAPLEVEEVDTDLIIPAEFLKTTSREGLGSKLFYRLRYDERGSPRGDFVLNDPRFSGARILVAGRVFGIGSSREHAVWALLDHGFRAVVASSFGDIFFENAVRNGLVCVPLPYEEVLKIRSRASRGGLVLRIDLERSALAYEGTEILFKIEEPARRRLLEGLDEIEYTLRYHLSAIENYERKNLERLRIKRLPRELY